MISCILLTTEKFQFRGFIVRDVWRTAVTELFRIFKNDSSGDFPHSKQCKYKEIYFSKISKVHKRKPTSLLAKVNSRCFFSYFRPPCLCPSEGHKYGIFILSSINLCGTLCQITRVRNTTQT